MVLSDNTLESSSTLTPCTAHIKRSHQVTVISFSITDKMLVSVCKSLGGLDQVVTSQYFLATMALPAAG